MQYMSENMHVWFYVRVNNNGMKTFVRATHMYDYIRPHNNKCITLFLHATQKQYHVGGIKHKYVLARNYMHAEDYIRVHIYIL